MSQNKEIKANERFRVTAYTKGTSKEPWLVLRSGDWMSAGIEFHLTVEEARQLAAALDAGASFSSGPRIGTFADLGIEETA